MRSPATPTRHWIDEVFEDREVVLDGSTFTRCTFRRCELVYRGEEPFGFPGSVLDGCTWNFQGAAERTIGVLRWLRGRDPDLVASIVGDDEAAPAGVLPN